MIGNVIIIADMESLSKVINIRNSTKVQSYIKAGKKPPKCKVIMIDDYVPEDPDYICGSILLPPANSMYSLIEGDYAAFEYMYNEKLYKDAGVTEYMIIILTGLMERGFDYIIYCDRSNMNMVPISNILFNFMHNKFGLNFIGDGDVMRDPRLLFNQAVAPEYYQRNKFLIDSYGYSDREPSLFAQF